MSNLIFKNNDKKTLIEEKKEALENIKNILQIVVNELYHAKKPLTGYDKVAFYVYDAVATYANRCRGVTNALKDFDEAYALKMLNADFAELKSQFQHDSQDITSFSFSDEQWRDLSDALDEISDATSVLDEYISKIIQTGQSQPINELVSELDLLTSGALFGAVYEM